MARIIDLTDIASDLAATDHLAVSDTSANQDKKLLISALKAFILEAKTLGGSGAADVTTNNAIQTLLNKTLTSPKINSSAATSATSEELDKLHGVSVGATQFNYLAGLSGNVQSQFLDKASVTQIAMMAKCCAVSFTASGTTHTLTESAIRTALGLGTDRRISTGIAVSVYDVGASTNSLIAASVTVTRGTGSQMDNVILGSLTSGRNYLAYIVCYDIGLGGGS